MSIETKIVIQEIISDTARSATTKVLVPLSGHVTQLTPYMVATLNETFDDLCSRIMTFFFLAPLLTYCYCYTGPVAWSAILW